MDKSRVQQLTEVGKQFLRAGRLDHALMSFRAAIEAAPEDAEANYCLSAILGQKGQGDQALECARRAVRGEPRNAHYQFYLGKLLQVLGPLTDAAEAYERAVALAPGSVEAWMNLAIVRSNLRQWEQAADLFRKALALSPSNPQVHANFGGLLMRMHNAAEAAVHSRRALALKPDLRGGIHMNLAGALMRLGRVDEAIDAYRAGLRVEPEDRQLCSGLIFALYYRGEEAQRLRQAHADCVPPSPAAAPPFPHDRNPDRPLRIGYMSPDFRDHAISFFIEPILERHRRPGFEVYGYSLLARSDGTTERLKRVCDQWRDVSGMGTAQAVEAIRADGIDILVDLALHSLHNRLEVLAQKPAPLQVAYLGYPGTTGLSATDYVLLDAVLAATPSAAQLCVEKIQTLEGSYFCYRPHREAPAVTELPARRNGCVTFGSFNNFYKLSRAALKLWVEVLRAVPGSRLLLKAVAFQDPGSQAFVRNVLTESGIEAARLEFRGPTPVQDYLASMGEVDIMFDAFPFNGGTTTCHALWMGVPVVSLSADLPTGRMGRSILTAAGLPEFIAESPEDFLRIAIGLAGDLDRQASYRGTLRQRLAQSPLMNETAAVEHLEAAYRQMWRQWCARSATP